MASAHYVDLGRRFAASHDLDQLDPDFGADFIHLSQKTETWGDLLARRCVVLLAEAGTGKTEEFKAQAERIAGDGSFATYLPLESLTSESLDAVVDPRQADAFATWKAENTPGYFFLDALDEAHLVRDSLSKALRKLKAGLGPRVETAHLLVSCRVSDWRPLEDREALVRFLEAWRVSPAEPHVVQLLPLNLPQVRLLAAQVLTDADELVSAIVQADARLFAERPADVLWLAEHWRRHRSLGSLHELMQTNLEEKLRERGDRHPSLPPERAEDGFLALSGVATVTGRRFVALPSAAHRVPPETLDATAVLPEWKADEVADLLRRAVFDEATYGRVRVHHRSVQEYAAARWLERLNEIGLPYAELEGLLLVAVEGGRRIVPEHLHPVAAWLAPATPRLMMALVAEAPSVLIGHGDPSRLDPATRLAVLRSFVGAQRQRVWMRERFAASSLARFACGEMVNDVEQALLDPAMETELKEFLLGLVRVGHMPVVAEAVLPLALDEDAPLSLRYDAVRAVGAIGSPAAEGTLRHWALSSKEVDPHLTAALVRTLFPGVLTVEDYVTILAATAFPRKSTTTLEMLLSSLSDLIDPRLRNSTLREWIAAQDAIPGEVPGRSWVDMGLGSLLHKCLEAESATDLPDEMLRALEILVRGVPRRPATTYWANQLWRKLDSLAAVRRWHFWRVAEDRRRDRGFPTRREEVVYHPAVKVGAEDVAWLTADVRKRATIQERLLAFDTLVGLDLAGEAAWARDRAVEDLVSDTSLPTAAALRRRLDRRRNPPYRALPDYRAAFHLQDRAREIQRAREHQQTLDWLHERLAGIRAGHDIDGLHVACRETGRFNGLDITLSDVSETFGPEVAAAAREGLKACWQRIDPDPFTVALGLAGIGLSVEDGLDPGVVDETTAMRLARFAALEPNGLPEWVTPLARGRPEQVRTTFAPCIQAELNTADATSSLLAKVRFGATEVQVACAPVVAASIESTIPLNSRALCPALELLLALPVGHTIQLRGVAERVREAATDPEQLAVWWAYWVNADGQAATEWLQRFLDENPEGATATMVTILARLEEWTDRPHNLTLPIQADARALTSLAVLAYAHVRPSDDQRHESVYSPNARDDAQDFRNRLIASIAAIGGAEARRGFSELLGFSTLERDHAWLRRLVEETFRDEAIRLWTVRDTVEWARTFSRPPRNPQELYDVVRRVLLDIRSAAESDDFAPPAAWFSTEADFQVWLADKLRAESRSRYAVVREEEVADGKCPDIRLHHPGCAAVSIEVKIADKWTGPELATALEGQLVEQYLSSERSRHGLYVLCATGSKHGWQLDGAVLAFPDLVARLEDQAGRILVARPEIRGLGVIGISIA